MASRYVSNVIQLCRCIFSQFRNERMTIFLLSLLLIWEDRKWHQGTNPSIWVVEDVLSVLSNIIRELVRNTLSRWQTPSQTKNSISFLRIINSVFSQFLSLLFFFSSISYKAFKERTGCILQVIALALPLRQFIHFV